MLAILITSAALLLLAAFSPAPIAAPIVTLNAASAEARAPWFFLWIQEMLKWGDPFLLGVLVPLAILTVLSLVPYVLPTRPRELGTWFPKSNRLAQMALLVILLAIAALTISALVPPG